MKPAGWRPEPAWAEQVPGAPALEEATTMRAKWITIAALLSFTALTGAQAGTDAAGRERYKA